MKSQRPTEQKVVSAAPSPARLIAAAAIPALVASITALSLIAPGDTVYLSFGLLSLIGVAALARPFPRSGTVVAFVSVLAFAGLLWYRLGVGPETVRGIATAAVTFGLVGFLTDLLAGVLRTAEVQAERDAAVIDELAERDLDTGAVRRRNADRYLGQEVERARRYVRSLSMVVISYAQWPELARSDDPAAMRRILSLTGQTLLSAVRGSDRVSRHSEGQFAIILPETTRSGAEAAARKLCSALERSTGLTACAGVAEFPTDAIRSSDLIVEAEAALEFALAAGLPVASGRLLDAEMIGTRHSRSAA